MRLGLAGRRRSSGDRFGEVVALDENYVEEGSGFHLVGDYVRAGPEPDIDVRLEG